MLPATLVAGAIAWWSPGSGRPRNALTDGRWPRAVLISLTVAAGVAALFYSSFFAAPAAMLEPFRAAGTYLDRGIDPVQPRPALALLPATAHVLRVRRPPLE